MQTVRRKKRPSARSGWIRKKACGASAARRRHNAGGDVRSVLLVEEDSLRYVVGQREVLRIYADFLVPRKSMLLRCAGTRGDDGVGDPSVRPHPSPSL